MKAWVVVAAWVWWTAVAGPALVWPLMVEDHQATLGYKVVGFSTPCATRDSYSQFVEALRRQLASDDVRHGIPVTRDPSTVPDPQRFLLVELSNGELVATLAVDVTDANVVGYRAGGQSFFFGDAPAPSADLFPGTIRHTLPFNNSYPALERVAREQRVSIGLGIRALAKAIMLLDMSCDETTARGLLVAIQMVSEAARFRYIEQLVRQSITGPSPNQNFRPDAGMISLEDNWGALSSAIQKSKDGVFSSPVRLQRPNFEFVAADSVTGTLIANLAFMVFVCKDQASQLSPLIRSVIATDEHDETCTIPEPTVRISGRNGLCVDVRDGTCNNGNPIQLWYCKSSTDPNQLWTLKTDGTIRSNGKCLTSYGYAPGDYVMIYDCPSVVTAATLWHVWDDGTVLNPESALALSAEAGNSHTTLTVQNITYAFGQAWLLSNNTDPFVTSIVGFQDLCMQANGDAVWLEECASKKAEQQWALYPDGSIRPQQNRDTCLTCADDSARTIVNIHACSLGLSGQRWVFRNDGTILNPNNKLVMDVRASDPSLHQIIIYPSTGNPNQKWLPLP